jgi:hypothetical protein
MVRAAASGAINYAGADPTEKNWRIRHRLLLREIYRQEDQKMLEHAHRHWCAFTGHGNLNEESFTNVKTEVANVLTDLQNVIYPWAAKNKKEAGNSTIDSSTQQLIDQYRKMLAETEGANNEQNTQEE